MQMSFAEGFPVSPYQQLAAPWLPLLSKEGISTQKGVEAAKFESEQMRKWSCLGKTGHVDKLGKPKGNGMGDF